LSDHPRAWAGFSDAWWVTPELIDKYGVLAFCRETDTACNSRANDLIGERKGWSCGIEARRFLLGMAGPLLRGKASFVPPKCSDAEQTRVNCDDVWAADGSNSLSTRRVSVVAATENTTNALSLSRPLFTGFSQGPVIRNPTNQEKSLVSEAFWRPRPA